MNADLKFSLGGQVFHLESLNGEVLSYNKRSQTQISGSGGGYNNAPLRIKSRTTIYTECFLRDPNGHEHEVRLVDEDHIALREGQHIRLIKAVAENGEYYWAFLRNETTETEFFLQHRQHAYKIQRRWQWLLFASSVLMLKFFFGWESWGLSILYGLLIHLLLNFSLKHFVLKPRAIRLLDREVERYIARHF